MKREALDHPKTRRLAQLLEAPRCNVWGLLEGLWAFTATYAITGHISERKFNEFCIWAEYLGEPEKLRDALRSAGFLDDSEDGYQIHDWDHHMDRHAKRKLDRHLATHGRPIGIPRVTQDHEKPLPDKPPKVSHGTPTGNPEDTQGDPMGSQWVPPTSASASASASASEKKKHVGSTGSPRDTHGSPTDDIEGAFDAFWEAYPRRNGTKGPKPEALRAWKRLSARERSVAMESLQGWSKLKGDYPSDAFRYLAKKRWAEVEEAVGAAQADKAFWREREAEFGEHADEPGDR